MEDILKNLEQEITNLFASEKSGHDLYHLKRVLNIALTIQEKEGGDRLIIAVSALLHDIHRIMSNENGKYCSPKESLPTVKKILDKTTLNEKQKENILHCIEYHEEYGFTETGKTAKDKETLIVQDADNLDAIGAIGMGRLFSYCGAHEIIMWKPDISLENQKYIDSKHDPSAIHHVYAKLLNLKNDMNTLTGKKMAEERHEFMEKFLTQFFSEWKGEK